MESLGPEDSKHSFPELTTSKSARRERRSKWDVAINFVQLLHVPFFLQPFLDTGGMLN